MAQRSRFALWLLLGLALAGCAADLSAQRDRADVIAVSGVGRVFVRPDTALVNLGAETRAPVLADATADVSRRMSEVLARLRALGIGERDVTTIQYAVDPIVAPRQKEQDPTRILAYHVANVVRVRIRDVTAAGPIVDAAVAAGANVVSSLQLTVDDPSRAESEARALAVKSAEAKAREIAAAGGVTLAGLLSVTEGPFQQPVPGPRALMAASAGPGPVEAGQFEIAVTVEARYRIAPR
ncbi:MAG TPA: SIMPL domain-containing protein [Candidatus Methylomirabilis sp.]|nr:SIMPL domain-containing protein [Candidatus Methylomirabilis sp.]